MESLKQLSEVAEPDVRQKFFVALDLTNGTTRPFTLEDFHRAAASITLHPGVPDKVRENFETARHLIIYSWFYYPFNITAQLSAYITVEFALRTRFKDRKNSFKHLLKKAVDAGLITDNGFTIAQRRAKQIREYNEVLPPDLRAPEPALVREYSDALTKALPYLRNEIAHGTTMLHNHGASSVRLSAELINQLFPAPTNPRPQRGEPDSSRNHKGISPREALLECNRFRGAPGAHTT
jgi:hypothetical protein